MNEVETPQLHKLRRQSLVVLQVPGSTSLAFVPKKASWPNPNPGTARMLVYESWVEGDLDP